MACAQRAQPRLFPGDEVVVGEPGEDSRERLADALPVGVHGDFGCFWTFVRIGHAGHVGNLPAQRHTVETLDVPPDQFVERAIGEDLDKRSLVLDSHCIPQRPVRLHGGRDGDVGVSR